MSIRFTLKCLFELFLKKFVRNIDELLKLGINLRFIKLKRNFDKKIGIKTSEKKDYLINKAR